MSEHVIQLRRPQMRIASDRYRFDTTVAGRRGGKTFACGVRLIRAATPEERRRFAPRIGYVAPTYGMAKRLVWPWLNEHIPKAWIADVSRGELYVKLVTGAEIRLFGAHSYDAMRGLGFDHLEYDEFQDAELESWEEVGRPALADRKGSAGFRGTPKGRGNHLFDFWDIASQREGWGRYHYTTLEGGLVDPEEVETARREMDGRSWRQEFEASFEDYGGLAYPEFDDVANVRESVFDPTRETFLCWDFNAGERPMSVICLQCTGTVLPPGTLEPLKVYDAVHEWVYPNTNTYDMCDTIVRDFTAWGYHPEISRGIGPLRVTGDSSGNRRESSASASDWLIIERAFRLWPGYEKSALTVRHIADRLNATNTLFGRGDGIRRLFIGPQCKRLRRGLVRVTVNATGKLEESTLGDIDPTDALSYMPYNYHPVHILTMDDVDWR